MNLAEKLGEYSAKRFFAGEFPVVQEVGTAGEEIDQYDVIMLAAEGAARMAATTASVPAPTTALLGKQASDLFSMGTYIDATGKVHGELYYVTGFEGYSNAKEEQSGNYFMLRLGDKYAGKEITAKVGDDGTEKKATDLEWVIRVQAGKKVTFKDDQTEILKLDFSGATLDAKAARAAKIAAAVPVPVSAETTGPQVILKATKEGIANVAGIAMHAAQVGEPVVYIMTGEVFADAINTNDMEADEAKAALRKLSIFLK